MEYEPLIYFYKYTQNKLQNSPPCETPVHSNCSESQTRGLWSLFTENSLFGTTNLNSMGISASLVPYGRVTWNLSSQNSMYDPSKLNSPFIPPSKEDPLQNLSVAGPLYQELLVQPNQDKLPVHQLHRQHCRKMSLLKMFLKSDFQFF